MSKQLRITILGKTRCVLLHFDSSKRFVCPMYKFLYAFKVVKLFLKRPVFLRTSSAHCSVQHYLFDFITKKEFTHCAVRIEFRGEFLNIIFNFEDRALIQAVSVRSVFANAQVRSQFILLLLL
jgi:hypothetical protein